MSLEIAADSIRYFAGGDLLDQPIRHIPAHEVRAAALNIAEMALLSGCGGDLGAPSSAQVGQSATVGLEGSGISELRQVLSMLGIDADSLSAGMFVGDAA